MQYNIFLSYSRTDTRWMHRLSADLQKLGYEVWTDEGIEPGTSSWQLAIEQAILSTGCLFCILSPAAAQSDWVREELNFARMHNKPIYLLLARGDERISIPFGYSSYQLVDIRDLQRYKTGMKQLIATIRAKKHDISTEPAAKPRTPYANLGAVKPTQFPPPMDELLPHPFEWCKIPAGEVTVANRFYKVDTFHIAKYPITNAQYRQFSTHEDGYVNDSWWDFSDHSIAWRKLNVQSIRTGYFGDDLPRTYVSWYEAIAFCSWLTHLIYGNDNPNNVRITLPTEEQWQRAAQGDDDREYPWGDRFSKYHCNTLKSGLEQPTPVTQYPTGASPYGVMDMCGNVSDWCLTQWETLATDLTSDTSRVLRGGSWDANRSLSRTFSRDCAPPSESYFTAGFRVVVLSG